MLSSVGNRMSEWLITGYRYAIECIQPVEAGTKGQVVAPSMGGCLVSTSAKHETTASITSVSDLEDAC